MQYPFLMQSVEIVEYPTKDDVLFGRHAQSWNHEGNRRFRAIVSKYQGDYHSAKARIKKVAIVAKIVNEVRSNGARFLKRDKTINKWYEVDRKACVEKVGHAIRDKQVIAHRSLRGRQEQYIKMKEEESEAKAASRIQPLAGNEPSRPPRVAMQPLSAQDRDLLLSLRRADLRVASAAPRLPAMQGRQLLFNNLAPQDSVESSLAAMRQEAAAAAQRLAAAEEYSANMKRRKELEEEIARGRNHQSSLLMAMTGEPPHPPPINPFLQGVSTLPSSSQLALFASRRAGFNPFLASPPDFGAFLPPRPPPSPPNPPHGS